MRTTAILLPYAVISFLGWRLVRSVLEGISAVPLLIPPSGPNLALGVVQIVYHTVIAPLVCPL